MTARSSLLRHGDDPVLRARDRAPDEQQIALGVHLHHGEAQLGVAGSAHVARHPLALDDSRRVGARADRAGLPVSGVAVRGRTTTKAIALHDALKSPTLGD